MTYYSVSIFYNLMPSIKSLIQHKLIFNYQNACYYVLIVYIVIVRLHKLIFNNQDSIIKFLTLFHIRGGVESITVRAIISRNIKINYQTALDDIFLIKSYQLLINIKYKIGHVDSEVTQRYVSSVGSKYPNSMLDLMYKTYGT